MTVSGVWPLRSIRKGGPSCLLPPERRVQIEAETDRLQAEYHTLKETRLALNRTQSAVAALEALERHLHARNLFLAAVKVTQQVVVADQACLATQAEVLISEGVAVVLGTRERVPVSRELRLHLGQLG